MKDSTNSTEKLLRKIVNEELQKVVYHEMKNLEKRLLQGMNKLLENKLSVNIIPETIDIKKVNHGNKLKQQIDSRNSGLSADTAQSLSSIFSKSPAIKKKFASDPVLNELLNSVTPVPQDDFHSILDEAGLTPIENLEEMYSDEFPELEQNMNFNSNNQTVSTDGLDFLRKDYSSILKGASEKAKQMRNF